MLTEQYISMAAIHFVNFFQRRHKYYNFYTETNLIEISMDVFTFLIENNDTRLTSIRYCILTTCFCYCLLI